jgi:alkylation response protein AidB-like acyl-CoA dehydrogenase
MTDANPLLDDRDVDFLLYDVFDAAGLTSLPTFSDHSRETFDLVLSAARRFARGTLFPTYRELDQSPPVLENGAVRVPARMRELWPKLRDLGLIAAPRSPEVHGQHLPLTIDAVATTYLCAGNLGAASWLILGRGTGHLIESFASDTLKAEYLEPLYTGQWTGTMALTEPHAGSSLADLTTSATPTEAGHYSIRGSKIFISGGDHDVTENIAHLVLARIDGAPAGTKGISLFVVPKLRKEGSTRVPNDIAITGLIHKIGWKALPSVAIAFGDHGDCHGWLVGKPNEGLRYMFQMMNEARIGVGLAATATAQVAYHDALGYATTRPQGRTLGTSGGPQVPIIEHADVRRMLLRQKAFVDASLALVIATARYADVAAHGNDVERARAQRILDVLTPITKTYPAERGFEVNVLALQVFGGYGYSSEYLPEAWLRDQKLNTIHEGTTGIQGLDLLGRKVVSGGGEALRLLGEEIASDIAAAKDAHVPHWDNLERVTARVAEVTMTLGARGMAGDPGAMMLHSHDYLELVGTWIYGWMWLKQATAASKLLGRAGIGDAERDLYEGKLLAARYFYATELPRTALWADLCTSGERSYADAEARHF